ncbi:sarcoplasmic calcium-binding protein-like [Mytilus californianus]|uniref:sarcoplasmic calcium-binding protein-like n=1 Tax=Mytilus californianus TaxID=6549 RepID=UPI00224601B2|nr:sarcoplasmic calcium-binding protein-like [Mytilus californianus]
MTSKTAPMQTRTTPTKTTPMPTKTTITPETTTTMPTKTAITPENNTSMPKKTTMTKTAITTQKTAPMPTKTTITSEKTTPIPTKTTVTLEKTTPMPTKTSVTPEKTTPILTKTTPVPTKTTISITPEKSTPIPTKSTPVVSGIEFLQEKWNVWFRTLDVNHDGIITRADVDYTLKQFPLVEGLSKSEGKMEVAKIEAWWEKYIIKGNNKITKADLLKDLEKEYTENKKNFVAKMKALCEDIFCILDTDKTKMISLDNYVKAYKVYGHDNEALLRKAFEFYNPSHGVVPLQEYIDDWLVFLTNDDPSKKDVVYETYKAGFV